MPNTIIQLWPGTAPGARGHDPADIPTLEWVRPSAAATGSAIIVCPGGGYATLADHEGVPVGERLGQSGVTAFVLKYRHGGGGYQHPIPLGDIKRAIRTVRARASEFAIDADRVGVLGFSAGGHLAATASTQFDSGSPGHADPIERQSSRPSLAVLLYPVITFSDPHTHAGSRRILLGGDATAEMHARMSAEKNVTAQTPPTFLFHTVDDAAVPVENALLYAAELRRVGVPFEMHLFEKGRHGVGLADDDPALSAWPSLLSAWLKSHGF